MTTSTRPATPASYYSRTVSRLAEKQARAGAEYAAILRREVAGEARDDDEDRLAEIVALLSLSPADVDNDLQALRSFENAKAHLADPAAEAEQAEALSVALDSLRNIEERAERSVSAGRAAVASAQARRDAYVDRTTEAQAEQLAARRAAPRIFGTLFPNPQM